MKAKIYIDFDGTLYDSNKLINNFLNICNKYGISKTQVQEVKKDLFTKENLFNLDILAETLYIKMKLPEEMLTEVEELYSATYLYKDVIEALDKIRLTKKYEVIILTYGNIAYQKKKIESSNLNEYLQDVIITESSKTNIKEADYKNGIFIDNNPYQIEKFIKAKARKVIRIRRESDKYSIIDIKAPISEYSNLNTLVDQELL